jgi:isopentenyldiphosphate isomerase
MAAPTTTATTTATHQHHRPDAEPDAELFELYDEHTGRPLRGGGVTVSRSRVHREGLVHAAAYGWVLDERNKRVLLQRRSDAKKIGPGQWDLSVAEHLEPGEGHRAAVVRGLSEELGLDAAAAERATCREACAPPGRHLRELVVPEVQVVDREWVESYVVRVEELMMVGGGGGGRRESGGEGGGGGEGEDDAALSSSSLCRALKYNPKEVSSVRWMGLEELRDACRSGCANKYTQWLREEGELLGWFLGGGGGGAEAR